MKQRSAEPTEEGEDTQMGTKTNRANTHGKRGRSICTVLSNNQRQCNNNLLIQLYFCIQCMMD